MITDRRKIDFYSKDYVFDDNSKYQSMNPITQRVYIALSRLRLTENRKKSANLTLYEINRITEALDHLEKKGYISEIEVKLQSFPSGMLINVNYKNLVTNTDDSIQLG